MDNDKTAGNDGISKQCYVTFSDFFKELLCVLIQQSFVIGESRGSQKQAIIKLMQKKYRDKSFIKSWQLVPFLNVDMKIISKALACRLNISTIVNENQVVYVNNSFFK